MPYPLVAPVFGASGIRSLIDLSGMRYRPRVHQPPRPASQIFRGSCRFLTPFIAHLAPTLQRDALCRVPFVASVLRPLAEHVHFVRQPCTPSNQGRFGPKKRCRLREDHTPKPRRHRKRLTNPVSPKKPVRNRKPPLDGACHVPCAIPRKNRACFQDHVRRLVAYRDPARSRKILIFLRNNMGAGKAKNAIL